MVPKCSPCILFIFSATITAIGLDEWSDFTKQVAVSCCSSMCVRPSFCVFQRNLIIQELIEQQWTRVGGPDWITFNTIVERGRIVKSRHLIHFQFRVDTNAVMGHFQKPKSCRYSWVCLYKNCPVCAEIVMILSLICLDPKNIPNVSYLPFPLIILFEVAKYCITRVVTVSAGFLPTSKI